jgi:hypothetical protein
LIEAFITEGFLSFRDLTFFEPAELAEMASVTEDVAEEMIAYAEDRADEIEEEEEARAEEEREAAKEAARQAQLGPKILVEETPPAPAEATGKEAFENLFAQEPAGGEAQAESPEAPATIEEQAASADEAPTLEAPAEPSANGTPDAPPPDEIAPEKPES